jgi:mannose/cellobiose epimerase-like protein (N-acyl-D-glucosamine 2-epimerase family)
MVSSALRSSAREAKSWLFEHALPLWYDHNIDRANWGFSELLDAQGRPTADPRRINVQARQVYVFAHAKAMGWGGDWEGPVRHGLQAMERYRRPDGLFCFKLNVDGSVADGRAEVYGQAFVLFAYAHAGLVLNEVAGFEAKALELLTTVRRLRGHARLGFDEDRPQTLPLRSNPHMHLFEACQVWMAIGQAPEWTALAEEIAQLVSEHFIEPNSGLLCEHFDADWNPMADAIGLLSEPGHQFEWAWLLQNYGLTSQRPELLALAENLHCLGKASIDPARGVPFMSWTIGAGPRPGPTRIWPVTEWLKSALAQGEDDEAVRAWVALKRFLNTSHVGLWYDQMDAEGHFIDAPAPASILYHIVCAISELTKGIHK